MNYLILISNTLVEYYKSVIGRLLRYNDRVYLTVTDPSPNSTNVRLYSSNPLVRTITSSDTVGEFDDYILADTTSGNITVTLPSASEVRRHVKGIKKISADGNTVNVTSSSLVDGVASIVLSEGKEFVSDGTNWYSV